MWEWSQALATLDVMLHVAVDALSINIKSFHRQVAMTSCRRNTKEYYAGAMLVQVMQIRAGGRECVWCVWCVVSGSSICSQLSPVHMIGRGSR